MVISISHQKANAILRAMGTTMEKVRRSGCCGYAEYMLFDTGAKIKYSPYDGWYIRTYGCDISSVNI